MIDKKPNILIRDQIPGSGKTNKMIDEINNSNKDRWLVVTPYLSECHRFAGVDYDSSDPSKLPIRDIKGNIVYNGTGCNLSGRKFKQPLQLGNGKLSNLKDLAGSCEDIVTTHATLKNFDMATLVAISNGKYNLVIDEELEIIKPFTGLKDGDIKTLFDAGYVKVNNDFLLSWCGPERIDFKYNNARNLIENGSLLWVNGKLLMWEYNPILLKAFKTITILTYNFEGSMMSAYLKYHGFDYILEKDPHNSYKQLINIVDSPKLNAIGKHKNTFSVTWSGRVDERVSKTVKTNTTSFFLSPTYGVATAEGRMWSCVKDSISKFKGKGYTKQHTPINLMATNDYCNVSKMAYLHNHYIHPYIKNLFLMRNTKIDEDVVALNMLLQWIFRSRVRNGEPINIYIPSSRMRKLLVNWLSD